MSRNEVPALEKLDSLFAAGVVRHSTEPIPALLPTGAAVDGARTALSWRVSPWLDTGYPGAPVSLTADEFRAFDERRRDLGY